MDGEQDKPGFYRSEDLKEVRTIATQMYEAEKQRGDGIERKGTYLIGFGGIVMAISAFAVDNLSAYNVPGQVLLIMSIVGMAWSVYCGIRVVRTEMYQVPDISSIEQNSSAEGLTREYVNDVMSAYRSHVKNSQTSGGWLRTGERWLAGSVVLLAISTLVTVLPSFIASICSSWK